MVLRRLWDAFHCRDFRKDFPEQTGFIKQPKAAASRAFGKELGEFLADAFGGDYANFGSMFADGPKGCGLNGVAEARCEADRAKHAEFVFREAAVGVADGADDVGLKIFLAADEIEDFPGVVAHE